MKHSLSNLLAVFNRAHQIRYIVSLFGGNCNAPGAELSLVVLRGAAAPGNPMLSTRTLPAACSRKAASITPNGLITTTQRPQRVRLARLAASSSDTTAVVDPTPSNGTSSTPAQVVSTTPAPEPTSSFQPSAAAVNATKFELLSELSALDRGTLATAAQRDSIENLVRSLEASGTGADAFSGSPAPIEGRWQLIYNSKAVFTAR